MPRPLLVLGLWAALLCLLPSSFAVSYEDQFLDLKHALGKLKMDMERGRVDQAEERITGLITTLEAMKRGLRDQSAKQEEEETSNGPVEPDPPVEFSWKTKHKPSSCSREAQPGDVLRVHYIGKLLRNNEMFDSSFKTGSVPVRFELGGEGGLAGWHRGLVGMCEGERRELIIPFELGFGEEGNDRVPPHSNLKYFVELVSISPGRRHPAGEEL